MPESVKDRFTKSHEYIFLFSKMPKYYFDHEAVQEDATYKHDKRVSEGRIEDNGKRAAADDANVQNFTCMTEKRNKRDVWTVQPEAYKGAHFATFPPKLIEPCILAGSKPGGIVLDPFFGSGTTGVVANKFNRSFIGIELNKEYIEFAKKRTANKQITLEGVI